MLGVRGCLGESPDTGWPDRWFYVVFLRHSFFAKDILTDFYVFLDNNVKIEKQGESFDT